ncbi:MAG: hypothetical protein CMP18_01220 [Rickettsiales bacterium]|nr:hypothetical protein [Rickettsiales bacterium]|tara:strand:- start:7447 stop:8310 length:864 start_codon:yes stop_codon:yes gene_type:complete
MTNKENNENITLKDNNKAEDNFVKRGIILVILIIILIIIYSISEVRNNKNTSYLKKITKNWQQDNINDYKVDNVQNIKESEDDYDISNQEIIIDELVDQNFLVNYNEDLVEENILAQNMLSQDYKDAILSLAYLKFKDKLLANKDLSKEFAFLKDQLIDNNFEDDIIKFEKIVKYYQNDKILSDNFNNISPKLIARDRNDPEDGFVNKFRFNLNNLIIIRGSKNNKSLSKIEKFIFLAQNILEVRDYKNLKSEINRLDVAFQDILSNFLKQIDVRILIEEFDNKYVY